VQTEPTSRVRVFASYAPEDTALQQELKERLRPLQQAGLIELWPDRDRSEETAWEQESGDHLETAQLILLLVSPDFLASDYCYDVEMKRALERHERGEARVIPVILRSAHWQETPLDKLQALPKKAKPVTVWSDREEAWRDVVEALSHAVDETLHRPKRP
jgi:TIR domain-containing protein